MRSFAGTGTLLRLYLRRDRVRVPVWVLGLVALMLVSVASVTDLYSTQESLDQFARIAEGNPAVAAINGRPVALDTLGGRVSFEVLVFLSATVGLMSLLLVTRHTRAEEQAGRTELLRAGIVGRHAQPAAAVLLAIAASLAVGLLSFASLAAFDLSLAGSAVLAAGVAMVGVVFAAIGVVTAQLTEHSRAASGIAGGALGAAFALRAVGDMGTGWLSWLSPIGWAQAAEPFGRDRWWPLLIGVVVTGVATAVAFRLVDRRDVGGGFIATRPGPEHASPALRSPTALAMRLHRAALVGWVAGVTAYGAIFGLVGMEVEAVLESTPELMEYFAGAEGTLTETFFVTVVLMLALATGGYVVQGLLRLRTEESDGRAELLLGRPVSRLAWAGGHVLVVGAGSIIILAVSGAATGLVHGLRAGDLSWVGSLAAANLAQLPAVWVLAGLALLLYGISPRLALVAWAALAGTVVVGFFAEPMQLPPWVRDLSPFSHLPQLPAADLTWGAPIAVLAVAVVLGAVGLGALRRRDIETT